MRQKYVQEDMEKTVKILRIIYNICHILEIKKIYLQAFNTNTHISTYVVRFMW